jgi:hypothetical protein
VRQEPVPAHRERSAFVAAPFAAAFLWYVVTLLHLVVVNGRIRWGPDVLAMAIGAVTWGLAIAWMATLLLALPIYWFVRRTLGVNFTTAIAGGIFVGLALSAAFLLVNGEWGVLFSPVHGGVVGAATAAFWWHLAGRTGARARASSH